MVGFFVVYVRKINFFSKKFKKKRGNLTFIANTSIKTFWEKNMNIPLEFKKTKRDMFELAREDRKETNLGFDIALV